MSEISVSNIIKMEKKNMPNQDGTGPEGKGSKTGRQMGKCKDAEPQERGFGRRCKPCGRGFRRRTLEKEE